MTDTTLNRYLATGDTAARTAFTPSPATPASGPDPEYLWYDTDDQILYAWDFVTGPGWVATGGGGVSEASTTEVLTGTETTKFASPDSLAAIWEQGSNVASGATISLGEGGHFNITGTTDISDIDFATDKAGRLATLVFADALTVTHGANLISYTGASLRTAAGTVMIIRSEGTDVIRILWSSGENVNNLRTIYPTFTRPVDGDFAWVNQGGAAVTVNANGGIHLRAPGNAGDSLRVRVKTAPATPYVITAAFLCQLPSIATRLCGLCWREAATGELITWGPAGSNTVAALQFECNDWGSPTSYTASNATLDWINGAGLLWLRIEDDGVDRTVSWSLDGFNFEEVFSEGRTTFLTADQVGFFVSSNTTASPASCTLISWKET